MTTRHIIGVSIAIWISLAAGVAHAGGFEIVQQSAAAGGTAHAGTARSDDASAAWFNPAALTDGGGLRVALGITLAAPTLRAEALSFAPDAPWEGQTESSLTTPPYAYLSYAHSFWLAGVSINVPFASRVIWPEDWPQRFDIISSKILFVRIAPFGGFRIGPIGVAVGPHIDVGNLDVLKATNHVAEEGRAQFVLNGHGAGLDIAVFAKLSEHVQLGATYKSRTKLPLDGDADFDVPDAFASAYPDQTVSSSWWLPDRIALGFMYRAKVVSVVADVSLTLWSVNDQLALDFAEDVTSDSQITNEWRDSLAIRAGVEIVPWTPLTIRAGLYVDGIPGAPPPLENLSPSSPDSTRIGMTVGAQVNFVEAFGVALFYEHMRLLARESESANYPLARYDGYAHFAGINLVLTVPNPAPKAPAVTADAAVSGRRPDPRRRGFGCP